MSKLDNFLYFRLLTIINNFCKELDKEGVKLFSINLNEEAKEQIRSEFDSSFSTSTHKKRRRDSLVNVIIFNTEYGSVGLAGTSTQTEIIEDLIESLRRMKKI